MLGQNAETAFESRREVGRTGIAGTVGRLTDADAFLHQETPGFVQFFVPDELENGHPESGPEMPLERRRAHSGLAGNLFYRASQKIARFQLLGDDTNAVMIPRAERILMKSRLRYQRGKGLTNNLKASALDQKTLKDIRVGRGAQDLLRKRDSPGRRFPHG
ncbi:hypothetical protein FHR70_004207 [Microvirga lupini]|uniref:Uncharacterized protein n=1 Tax=Microvirga lupini TaxID=420324 RepID=A0A7W4VPX5_9HYPH|nr:hypothetical protein [Microvirga lupini]MBB3021117.1 hypothetical protein [Microvirga lupini]